MAVQMRVHASGLLDYAKAGKDAVRRIRRAMRRALNVGRKVARQRIASEFTPRTGLLRQQARKMQTKVTVKAFEIKGRVKPIPRLMNIFEGGATLAKGRGFLHPRPVVAPAAAAMEAEAAKTLTDVMHEIGR
jgi:hypothetical protein